MSDVLIGGIEKREIVIADYDPQWPAKFQNHAATISAALSTKALAIEHVGSTSVPELAAKPSGPSPGVPEPSAERRR